MPAKKKAPPAVPAVPDKPVVITVEPAQIARVDRTYAFLEDPARLESICRTVANGGSLVNITRDADVRYTDVIWWMYDVAHPHRKAAYETALRDRGEWEVEAILKELRAIALLDIREAFNDDGSIKPISEMSAGLAGAVASIEVNELWGPAPAPGEARTQIGLTKKVKFWPKVESIALIAKKAGLLIDRREVKIGTLEDLVADSWGEVKGEK